MNRGKLLTVVGPTGVGKTALSVELATRFNGEVVSADSRLLYKGMDIGTDKPDIELRLRVAHHLIDICHPDETISLGQYKRMAMATIDVVHRRGNLPILVGGTGQYVRAIVEGWQIPEVPPQEALREVLRKFGGPELYRWLGHLDPQSAEAIDARNVRRVIRALEVTLISGQPMSVVQRKEAPELDIMMVGLRMDRELLYQRIDERVEKMVAEGLVEEVERLRAGGYQRHLPAMSGLGYRQIWAYLDGEITLDESIERIKFETHRFARQQHNWFRRKDSNIRWYNTQHREWKAQVFDDVGRFVGQS